MKHSIDYYIERVESLLAFQRGALQEITIENTTFLVVRFSRYNKKYIVILSKYDVFGIAGWFYNMEDRVVTNIKCTTHYIQRFKNRYLYKTKLEGNNIWSALVKRVLLATPTEDPEVLIEPKKMLKHIVKIDTKKGMRRLVFVTCYMDNKLKVR